MLVNDLGLARKVLKEVYVIESKKVQDQSKMLIPRFDSTTQSYELYKQLIGFAMPEITPEGNEVAFDNMAAAYQLKLSPYLITKGVRYSKLMNFTNQYRDVTSVMPAWTRSYMHKRNQIAGDVFNNGFTSGQVYAINSEALFSTSHSMGVAGATFSNRPAVDVSFGPAGVKQGLTELRKQKSARNTPQPIIGKVRLIVPPAQEASATEVVNSMLLANTNDNNTNEFIRNRVELFVCDYLTADRPYFLVSTDPAETGLVWLDQMPFDIEQLPRDTKLMDTWVSSQSLAVGFYDCHGAWGTTG